MKFEEALQLLKQGKKIRRKEWECLDTYLTFNNNDLKLVDDGGEFQEIYYHLSKNDIFADDWEKYKETLLTEEEKEYLRMVIKFHHEDIISILVGFREDCNLVFFEYKDGADCVFTAKDYFKNLKENHSYTLEELRL